MTKVQIIPNKKTGALVNPYQSNPEFGYIQLQQKSSVIENGWIREKKRNTLLRATVNILSEFVSTNKTLSLNGNIVVKEFVESEVPVNYAERFFDKSKDYESAIAPYVKRTKADGIELTVGGERIIRFTEFDPSGTQTDISVAHDNVEAVREAMTAAADDSSAEF